MPTDGFESESMPPPVASTDDALLQERVAVAEETDEGNDVSRPSTSAGCSAAELEPLELYLSADDSNSQASARVAARLIEDGRRVPAALIRTYEFLNYYDMGYHQSSVPSLKVLGQARKVPAREDAFSLQVAVLGPSMLPSQRLAMNLTVLVDVSGSMAGAPFERAKDVLRALSVNLAQGDIISLVSFANGVEILLDAHQVQGADDAALSELLDELRPSGRTNLHEALTAAYNLTAKNAGEGRRSRLILVSDGHTNTGAQSVELISQMASRAEGAEIFLVGVAVGSPHGINFELMDRVTDAGKGAFVYVDSADEAYRAFGNHFLANLELAALDVRTKMVLPGGFRIEEFHGEQISTVASEVQPQHLGPNDTMIYHQIIRSCSAPRGDEVFVFETEFTDPHTKQRKTVSTRASLDELYAAEGGQIIKGDAIVAFAEMLKATDTGEQWRTPENQRLCQDARAALESAAAALPNDRELPRILEQAQAYCKTLEAGELLVGSCDCGEQSGYSQALELCSEVSDVAVDQAGSGSIAIISALGQSDDSLSPRAGCAMLALSSGVVGEAQVVSGAAFGSASDPIPEYNGAQRIAADGASAFDRSQLTLTLTAPPDARSFSFDFVFFSAEYPQYVGSSYNDTFYAILRADSSNGGASTNISFDGNGNSIEVDNNYFQNEYHPCSEWGTGFHYGDGGSTCWLRTSWPINGGETFTLTFSIHDEGDQAYSSTVLIDNFQWHPYEAVGATDPVN
jgi:Ca-activated chloride channel family protein